MKNRLFLTLVLASSMTVSNTWAGSTSFKKTSKDSYWVGELSAGPIWVSSADTQTFYLSPSIEKTYVAKKSTSTANSGELFLGLQKALSVKWLGQLGLALGVAENTKFKGEIWDDANSEFNNHKYQYKLRNTRLGVKGKLLLNQGWVMPWVSANFGVGSNRAYDFSNVPLLFEGISNSNFSNKTKTSFTYALSFGIQKLIKDHLYVGVGYEFADWGKSELGQAQGQTMGDGLKLNHLYTNGILINLAYVS